MYFGYFFDDRKQFGSAWCFLRNTLQVGKGYHFDSIYQQFVIRDEGRQNIAEISFDKSVVGISFLVDLQQLFDQCN
jgi:hypothetical protein